MNHTSIDQLNKCIKLNESTITISDDVRDTLNEQGNTIDYLYSKTYETDNLMTKSNSIFRRITFKEKKALYLKMTILFVMVCIIIMLITLIIITK